MIRNYDWSHLDQNRNEWQGGLRKIGDIERPCGHPEHNPPNMMVLKPGICEHICPGCGKKIIFRNE